jgi:hypothetical protein
VFGFKDRKDKPPFCEVLAALDCSGRCDICGLEGQAGLAQRCGQPSSTAETARRGVFYGCARALACPAGSTDGSSPALIGIMMAS